MAATLSDVRRKGALFRQGLESLVGRYPDVFDHVRGEGLMLGLVCRASNADLVAAAYEMGVTTVPAADNTVRLLPPLTITDDEVAEALNRLERAAQRVSKPAMAPA